MKTGSARASTWAAILMVVGFVAVVALRPWFEFSLLLYACVWVFSAFAVGSLAQRIPGSGGPRLKFIIIGNYCVMLSLAFAVLRFPLRSTTEVIAITSGVTGMALLLTFARTRRQVYRFLALHVVLTLVCLAIADLRNSEEWFPRVALAAGSLAVGDRVAEFGIKRFKLLILDPITASAVSCVAFGIDALSPRLGPRTPTYITLGLLVCWALATWGRVIVEHGT